MLTLPLRGRNTTYGVRTSLHLSQGAPMLKILLNCLEFREILLGTIEA